MCVFFKLKSNDKFRYERQNREGCQKPGDKIQKVVPGLQAGKPWKILRGMNESFASSLLLLIHRNCSREFFLPSSFSCFSFLLPFYFFLCLKPLLEAKSTGMQAPYLAGRNKLFPTVFLASAPYSSASFLSKTGI